MSNGSFELAGGARTSSVRRQYPALRTAGCMAGQSDRQLGLLPIQTMANLNAEYVREDSWNDRCTSVQRGLSVHLLSKTYELHTDPHYLALFMGVTLGL
jgi:hypothetical protein